MKKKRTQILVIILLPVLVILGIKIHSVWLQNVEALSETLPTSYFLDDEYYSLFNTQSRKDLKTIEVFHNKVRNDVAISDFKNEYHLLIHKLNFESNSSLKNSIQIEERDKDITTGVSYGTIGKDIIYRFRYKGGTPERSSHIYLTFSGKQFQPVILNDTMVSYHLIAKSFSVRNSIKGPVDILVIGEQRPFGIITRIPLDILFVQRQKSIYLLIMTPKNIDNGIDADLLYNVIK